jgi:hypothetical protein
MAESRHATPMQLLRPTICATVAVALACAPGDPPAAPEAPLSRLQITTRSETLLVRDTAMMAATLLDRDGRTVTGRTITWQVADPAVASIDGPSGRLAGIAPGTTAVYATHAGLADTITVAIRPRPIAELRRLSGDTAVVRVANTILAAPLQVAVRDDQGVPVPNVEVRWSTPDTLGLALADSLATTDSAGTARMAVSVRQRAGAFRVQLRASGAPLEAQFVVELRPVALRFAADTVQLWPGDTLTVPLIASDSLGTRLETASLTIESSAVQASRTPDGSVRIGANQEGFGSVTARAGTLAAVVTARVGSILRGTILQVGGNVAPAHLLVTRFGMLDSTVAAADGSFELRHRQPLAQTRTTTESSAMVEVLIRSPGEELIPSLARWGRFELFRPADRLLAIAIPSVWTIPRGAYAGMAVPGRRVPAADHAAPRERPDVRSCSRRAVSIGHRAGGGMAAVRASACHVDGAAVSDPGGDSTRRRADCR